jgi:hypothetical protein
MIYIHENDYHLLLAYALVNTDDDEVNDEVKASVQRIIGAVNELNKE